MRGGGVGDEIPLFPNPRTPVLTCVTVHIIVDGGGSSGGRQLQRSMAFFSHRRLK